MPVSTHLSTRKSRVSASLELGFESVSYLISDGMLPIEKIHRTPNQISKSGFGYSTSKQLGADFLEHGIDLDGHHPSPPMKKYSGQVSRTGTHFEHEIAGTDRRGIRHGVEMVRSKQEILPPATFESKVPRVEGGFQLARTEEWAQGVIRFFRHASKASRVSMMRCSGSLVGVESPSSRKSPWPVTPARIPPAAPWSEPGWIEVNMGRSA